MPEKIIIGISVENKIAKADKNAVIVCGNSNYKAVFAFDGEWESYNVKTALFATDKADNDGNGTIAVVFEGNECDIPPLENTTIVGVGVASGDLTQGEEVELATTTPAYIDCLLSIKDLGGVISPPSPDVYDQIIALLNKYLGQGGGGSGETGGGLTEAEVKEIVQAETEGLQPKTDDGLETESKSVVGAINETNSKALATIESSIADGTYSVKLVFQNAKGEAIAETTLDLPLSEFVKFTDKAGPGGKFGVVSSEFWGEVTVNNNGMLMAPTATNAEIADRYRHRLLRCSHIDYAVKVGITTNTETLTDEEKAAACGWLGAVPKVATTSSRERIYGISPEGEPYIFEVGKSALGNSIAKRIASGGLIVPQTPTGDMHAASKKYVDDNKGTKLYKHTVAGLSGIEVSDTIVIISTSATPATDQTTLSDIAVGCINAYVPFYGKIVSLLEYFLNQVTMQWHNRVKAGELESIIVDTTNMVDTVTEL